jgi:hypothetical protein
MQKSKTPELKHVLRKHLNSNPFQKAFKEMVERSVRNGCEHAFHVRMRNNFKVITAPVFGGASPNTTRNEGELGDPGLGFSICGFHTHPFHAYQYDLHGIPSADDVRNGSSDASGLPNRQIEGLVSLDIGSGKFGLVIFQAISALSYFAYEGILDEFKDEPNAEQKILRAATERSVLRVLTLKKRTTPIISDMEIEIILEKMDLIQLAKDVEAIRNYKW